MPVIPKNPGRIISQGQGIYFSRPEKHPFSGRKSTQFFLKNHYILWFYPPFLSKTTIYHLNYRSLMWCCGGIDANPEILSLQFHQWSISYTVAMFSSYEIAASYPAKIILAFRTKPHIAWNNNSSSAKTQFTLHHHIR